VVSCITIDAQVIFKMLLVLVTGQLVIAGQLGREVHLWSIGFFLGAGDRDNFEEVLVDETTGNGFALF